MEVSKLLYSFQRILRYFLIGSKHYFSLEAKTMEKTDSPITFLCPGCKQNFDFDNVDEYQFVPCPICGTDFMTIKKGQTLLLENFPFEEPTDKTENSQLR